MLVINAIYSNTSGNVLSESVSNYDLEHFTQAKFFHVTSKEQKRNKDFIVLMLT